MRTAPFGKSGPAIPVIGQGTWYIDEARHDDAVKALRHGIDLGLTHIDTAEMYGSGAAEEVVADAIAGRRDEVFLVSKVLPYNASRQGTIAACEESLARLATDHLDCYRDLEDIKGAFIQFANKVPFYGFIILCLDEPDLLDIMPQMIRKKIITYGINPQADVQAADIRHKDHTSTFTVVRGGTDLGDVTIQVPGKHNVQNALAAITTGLELNIPFAKIKSGIEKFTGVYRRWEKKGEANGISIYDDYAHHPTECRATLSGVKAGWRRRVVCVFQPHLYSRTRDFYDEFGKSFLLSDVLIVTDVYPAREEPIQGVTGELIVQAAKRFGHKDVQYVPDKKDVAACLSSVTKQGDIVITMGAGDIWKYGEDFVKLLEKGT